MDKSEIKVVEKHGQPSIDGMICTFETIEIRNEIEEMFETNKTFILPEKYTYTIMPSSFHGRITKSSNGNVAKIILANDSSNVEKISSLSSLFLTVISKLPHSEGRVPYTYHHDYLRMNVSTFKGSSRSEVASNHNENTDELCAVALTELLNEIKPVDMMNLTSDDFEICKKAIQITKDVVSRYNSK